MKLLLDTLPLVLVKYKSKKVRNPTQCNHLKGKTENRDTKVKFELIGKNNYKNGDKQLKMMFLMLG